MEISVQSFEKICRICLIECTDMKSLFSKTDDEERNLLEILEYTANINVHIEDNLPKQVCCECQDVMCKADAFKRRCLESEKILNNLCEISIQKEETQSSNDNDYCIKHENSDVNDQLAIDNSFQLNNGKDSLDVKNGGLFKVIAVYPAGETIGNIDTNISDNCAIHVKVEAVNKYEDDTDFSNHFNDAEDTSYSVENSDKKLKTFHQCNCGLIVSSIDKLKSHVRLGNCKQKKVKQKLSKKVAKTNKVCSNNYDKIPPILTTWEDHQQTQNEHIDNTEPLECLLCLKTFKTKALLAAHKHEKSEKREFFQCSLCLRRFKNKKSLSTHIQRHKETDNIKHVCEVCKREFKYKAFLENHIITVHSKKRGYSCDVCSQSFSSEQMLEDHKDVHKGNRKKHQCTVCSKLFVMSCTLKEHMRTHTGEKPFLCSQCGRGFSQKTNLAQHMRRHQGLKPFKCENCEKR